MLAVSTDLNHGDLVGHEAVANHKVALRYVQAFLGDGGGDQQVDFSVSELVQNILLFGLQREIIPESLAKERSGLGLGLGLTPV